MNVETVPKPEPRKPQDESPKDGQIVAFENRRPEVIERRRLRREVRRLTIREYDGRSWENDHELGTGRPTDTPHRIAWQARG